MMLCARPAFQVLVAGIELFAEVVEPGDILGHGILNGLWSIRNSLCRFSNEVWGCTDRSRYIISDRWHGSIIKMSSLENQ